jgi:putative transposase
MRGDGFLANNSLEHVIICNEAALYRHVKSLVVYYHASRTHLALGQEAPEARPVQPLEHGPVIAIPQVGGLHHRYERRAA